MTIDAKRKSFRKKKVALGVLTDAVTQEIFGFFREQKIQCKCVAQREGQVLKLPKADWSGELSNAARAGLWDTVLWAGNVSDDPTHTFAVQFRGGDVVIVEELPHMRRRDLSNRPTALARRLRAARLGIVRRNYHSLKRYGLRLQ